VTQSTVNKDMTLAGGHLKQRVWLHLNFWTSLFETNQHGVGEFWSAFYSRNVTGRTVSVRSQSLANTSHCLQRTKAVPRPWMRLIGYWFIAFKSTCLIRRHCV